MDSFIDKFIFNPNQVSIIEFLANYFISILATIMPILIIIALILTVFQWIISGATKSALIENFVRFLLSISLVSVLLFTTGRKDIQLDTNKTIKSYFIVDTLSDFLVLGSRIADAFTYNFLFGFHYSNSDKSLFSFDKKHFLKLDNYNITPTGEDYVDGFFVSGLLNIAAKNIEKKYVESELLKGKILSKYNNDIDDLKDVDDTIKTFVYSKDCLKVENFYKYKNYFDKKFQVNLNKAISEKRKSINDNNAELTPTEYTDVYRNTLDNLQFHFMNDFYNFRIITEPDIDKKTYSPLTIINLVQFVYTTKWDTRYNIIENSFKVYSGHNKNIKKTEIIDKDEIIDDIKEVLEKDKLLDGIKVVKNLMVDNNLKFNFDIDNELENLKDYNTNYNEMIEYFKKYPKYKDYLKLVNKDEFTFNEAKTFYDLFFSYLRYKQIKLIGEMYSPDTGFQLKKDFSIRDKIFLDRFSYFNSLLEKTYDVNNNSNRITDNGLKVRIKAITIFNSKFDNSANLTKKQIENVLLKVNNLNFLNNYSIGSEFIEKSRNNNGFIKLKYLSNDFLLKNELNNILVDVKIKGKKLFSLDLNMDEYKKPDIKPFHWYDLNRYSVGLKNLFLESNTFYSNMGVYSETLKANTLITTCLPIYQKIDENPSYINELPSDISSLCFPDTKSKEYTVIDNISKIFAVIQGVITGVKVTSALTLNKGILSSITTVLMPESKIFQIVLGIFAGILAGTIVGYIVYIITYSSLLYFIFLVPSVFIFIAVVSWIMRASMALVFFGFSIIMYLFNQKKDKLIENFYTFIMYTIMPLFLSFIIFLIIHLSFVLSLTISDLMPNIGQNYLLGKNYNEVVEKIIKDPNVIQNENSIVYKYVTSKYQKTKTFWKLKDESLKTITVLLYNSIIDNIKFFLILVMDLILYINLWKIDKFINEIIGTSVKSMEFNPNRIVATFGSTSRSIGGIAGSIA